MRHRCIAAALCTAAGLATAQPIDGTFTYQGELKDAGVLADGLYDINFALFAQEIGGAALTNDLIEDVQVEDGLFTVDLDFGLAQFEPGQKRWMLIQVSPANAGAFQSLTPRQELTSTPFASFAVNADAAAFAASSGTDLQEAFDNGNVIDLASSGFSSGFRITRPADSSRVFVFDSDSLNSVALFGSQPPSGADAWFLSSDTDIGSNILKVARNLNGNDGLRFVGLDNESNFRLTGNTSIFEIDTDDSDTNNRAVLPGSSVSPAETLGEAGLAERSNSLGTFLTASDPTIDVLDSVTVDCPTDGYVLVIASAEAQVAKSGTAGINANLAVSSSPTSIPAHGDIEVSVLGTQPNGSYNFPATVHNVFPVSAGPNTFYFLGDQNTTGVQWFILDRQLSCVFVPTAYGSASRSAPDTGTDLNTASQRPMTPGDIAAERAASIAANDARIAAELDAMRARIEELEAHLAGKVLRGDVPQDR